MNSKALRTLHRRLGIVFLVFLISSTASGVLHTIMARTQSPPPKPNSEGIPLRPEQIKVSLDQAIRSLPLDARPVTAVNLRMIEGVPWYLIYRQGISGAFYIQAETGILDKEADEKFATQIASRFLGGVNVRKTDYLTSFNSEYINIFRILPVYRFDVDDGKGTRVYVSTFTETVTRHTDDRRQWEANLFSTFHKFMFIKNRDLRDAVLVSVTVGMLLASLAGLGVWILGRR